MADVADEYDLEGRHEGWGLGAVQYFENRSGCQVKVGEAEVAEIGRDEGAEDSRAAAIEKEDFVANEDVAGAEGRGTGCRGIDFGHKTAYRGEARTPAPAAHRAKPIREEQMRGREVQIRSCVGKISAETMRLQNTLCGCEKAVPNS